MYFLQGYTNIVKFLIGRGSEIDIQTIDGYSALIFASYYGHADVVKILLVSQTFS